MSIEPKLYRGMRDYLPQDMLSREKMLEKVRETFRRWGYAPLATPAIEFKEILTGKYGDMADRLIYDLKHKSGLALRYDLTVPLARVVAMYPNDFPTPFKRYQIQEVWRAERAQPRQGRFREFLQCDVDIVGSDSPVADAEIIALSVQLLAELGFPNAVTRVNHRSLLRGLMEISKIPPEREIEVCRIIDKLDKVGKTGIYEELLTGGYPQKCVDTLFDIILCSGENRELLDFVEDRYSDNERIIGGIKNLREVLKLVSDFGIPSDLLKVDLSLSRGLDYYTGTIFESANAEQPHIGSLTGGGRYDDLIGIFSGKQIPAVGITIGLDRILAALKDAGKLEERTTSTRVLVTVFDEKLFPDSIGLATELRKAGIPSEVYLETRKLKQQFSYADKLGIPFVAVIGEDEKKKGVIALKDMKTGEQENLTAREIIELAK
ncbi:histidine--tRNA ligase [bacterium]|nr:MAG: histidine--tRNA ligase [bacterium]